MARTLVLKWNGQYPSTEVIFKADTSDPSTLDFSTLPYQTVWSNISTNNNGTWVAQGETGGIGYSTDDGDTWTGLSYETEFDFTLAAKPNTNGTDGRPEVTYTPYPKSLYFDGSQFVMYGWSVSESLPGVAWTSPDGFTWTLQDLPNGGLAYHNNTHTTYGGAIPQYVIHDRDRQGRYPFLIGNFYQYPSPRTEYSLGVEDAALGTWSDVGFETELQSRDGTSAPYWAFSPFAADAGESSFWYPHRYGFEYVGGQGYPVNFKKNRYKTDGSNLITVGDKSVYQRRIVTYDIGHWDTTPVLNTGSGYMEIPWPDAIVGYSFNLDDGWFPQEVVFTGDYWIGAGGMLNPSSGVIDKWAYGISTDGGATWDITEEPAYNSDVPRCSSPECWDMQFDGQYIWYFGRERSQGILDAMCVWGVYDTLAATPSWEFFWETGGLGFGESECGFNVLSSFIYTDVTPVISITCEDATTHTGRVLRTNTVLNLGDIVDLDYRNIRGSASVSIDSITNIYKFNSISFSTSAIKIGQKNLLLTETEIVKVRGMPLGVGGRFAQLNHYVRNIYGDHPVVYLPLNDRDEDINGTPQNSETDDLQQEVF